MTQTLITSKQYIPSPAEAQDISPVILRYYLLITQENGRPQFGVAIQKEQLRGDVSYQESRALPAVFCRRENCLTFINTLSNLYVFPISLAEIAEDAVS